MNQTLLLQRTGEQKELLMQLEIKDLHVDHAGLSQQLQQWKEHTKLSMELFVLYPNNNFLIVTNNLEYLEFLSNLPINGSSLIFITWFQNLL